MVLKVKICGVKSINHVKACIKGKAKMIGFNFYNKSEIDCLVVGDKIYNKKDS